MTKKKNKQEEEKLNPDYPRFIEYIKEKGYDKTGVIPYDEIIPDLKLPTSSIKSLRDEYNRHNKVKEDFVKLKLVDSLKSELGLKRGLVQPKTSKTSNKNKKEKGLTWRRKVDLVRDILEGNKNVFEAPQNGISNEDIEEIITKELELGVSIKCYEDLTNYLSKKGKFLTSESLYRHISTPFKGELLIPRAVFRGEEENVKVSESTMGNRLTDLNFSYLPKLPNYDTRKPFVQFVKENKGLKLLKNRVEIELNLNSKNDDELNANMLVFKEILKGNIEFYANTITSVELSNEVATKYVVKDVFDFDTKEIFGGYIGKQLNSLKGDEKVYAFDIIKSNEVLLFNSLVIKTLNSYTKSEIENIKTNYTKLNDLSVKEFLDTLCRVNNSIIDALYFRGEIPREV